MSKRFRSLFALLAGLCLGGILLSFSEPAAFLDQQAALLVLRCMPTHNRSQVAKVVLRGDCSAEQIADRIGLLKSQGVRGILLMATPQALKATPALGDALALEGVVWVADPAGIDPALARRATCRPLLICAEFGSAILAKKQTNALRSATALALTCSKDVTTFRRLGSNPFKLLFHQGAYLEPGSTNTVLACLTKDDSREPLRYNTPVGQKPPADYALDICQALLDQRYLVEVDLRSKCVLAGALGLLFGCLRTGRRRFGLLLALLAVLFAVSLLGKILLPIGTALLLSIFAIAAAPILAPEKTNP